MTIDDMDGVRARLDESLGSEGLLTAFRPLRDDLRALLDDHERLRSLPVIPCCAECAHCVKGSARYRCEHLGAPLDDAGKAHAAGRRGPMGQCKTVEPDDEPPSWCPLRKAGGR